MAAGVTGARPVCRNLTLLLFLIVVALELWGEKLANKKVCFWTNNLSVAHCINKLSSSSLSALSLLHHLVLRCLTCNISFLAHDVLGVEFKVADALSHFQFQVFHSWTCQVSHTQSIVGVGDGELANLVRNSVALSIWHMVRHG